MRILIGYTSKQLVNNLKLDINTVQDDSIEKQSHYLIQLKFLEKLRIQQEL